MKQNRQNPFFLFVSHYYVHTPLGTPCQWLIDKYRIRSAGKYSEKRIQYGAFVETMDYYVGQLLNSLNELGLADNTLVVLTSDNGGHPEFAFNAPLRGSKWNLYEGGVRVPMIVRWPQVVRKASLCNNPITQMDFLPTFNELAGVQSKPVKELDGESIVPLLYQRDGKRFKHRSLYWHFPNYHPETNFDQCKSEIGIEDGYISRTTPQSAIREGEYKLIYFYESKKSELYHLTKDIGEQNDLSQTMPEKSRVLQEKLFSYLNSVDARLPRKNPKEKT